MNRFGRACAVVLGVSVLMCGVARADDQDTIDYRKHVMKTLGEQMASIGMILQQKAPADNLATHAQILSVTASTAKKAFEPKVAGGEAKPEVWSNWADFSKRMDQLVTAAQDLAKAAKDGGAAAVGPKTQALGCKGCHDNYRVAKK